MDYDPEGLEDFAPRRLAKGAIGIFLGAEVADVGACAAASSPARRGQGRRSRGWRVRVILAGLDNETLKAAYEGHELEIFTSQTPKTVAELETTLAGDRQRGFAVSHSFFESGISAVAAPVRDVSGQVVGAINATALMAHEISGEVITEVVLAAVDISSALGYKPGRDQAANF